MWLPSILTKSATIPSVIIIIIKCCVLCKINVHVKIKYKTIFFVKLQFLT